MANEYQGNDTLNQIVDRTTDWVVRDNASIARTKGLAARSATTIANKSSQRVVHKVFTGITGEDLFAVETNAFVIGGLADHSEVGTLYREPQDDEQADTPVKAGTPPKYFQLESMPVGSRHYLNMLKSRGINAPLFLSRIEEARFTRTDELSTYVLDMTTTKISSPASVYVSYKMTVTPGVWVTPLGGGGAHGTARFVVEWDEPQSFGADKTQRYVFYGVITRIDDEVAYIGDGSTAVTIYTLEDGKVAQTNAKRGLTVRLKGQVLSSISSETEQIGELYRQFNYEAGSSWGFMPGTITALLPENGSIIDVTDGLLAATPISTLGGTSGTYMEDIVLDEGIKRGMWNYLKGAMPATKYTTSAGLKYVTYFLPLSGDCPSATLDDIYELEIDGQENGRGQIEWMQVQRDAPEGEFVPSERVYIFKITLSNPAEYVTDRTGDSRIRGGQLVRKVLMPTARKSANGELTTHSNCTATEYSPVSVCGHEAEEIAGSPEQQQAALSIFWKIVGGGMRSGTAGWFLEQLAVAARADSRQTPGMHGKLRAVDITDFMRCVIATVAAHQRVADAPIAIPGSVLKVMGGREGRDGEIRDVDSYDSANLRHKFPVSTTGDPSPDALHTTMKVMEQVFTGTRIPFEQVTGAVDFLTAQQQERARSGVIAELDGYGGFAYLDPVILHFQTKCRDAVASGTPRFLRMYSGETVLFFYTTGGRPNYLSQNKMRLAVDTEGILVVARQRATAQSLNTAWSALS